jgi:hypothetical protein
MESDLNTPKKTGKKNPFCNKAASLKTCFITKSFHPLNNNDGSISISLWGIPANPSTK